MADAIVTIKMTTYEFNLIFDMLSNELLKNQVEYKNMVPSKEKQNLATRIFQLKSMKDSLRGKGSNA